jgi:hypothetical protein
LISRQQAAFLACAASSCPNSSAVVFFGRSMGVSVASIKTTSNARWMGDVFENDIAYITGKRI